MASYSTIDIADTQLETCRVGPTSASGPTLVFLHEGLGCISMWKNFPSQLCERLGLRGFIYSRAGYGGSGGCELPRRSDYMHVEGQVVLQLVLEAAGIDDAILVGHSDGGSIALVAAACDVDNRIRAIVTLAAHVFVEDVSISSIMAAKVAFETGGLRLKLQRHHKMNVDDMFNGWCDAWLNPEFRQWNLVEYLPDIKVPALVLQGGHDPYGTGAQVDAIVEGIGVLATSQLIEDCGHHPHLEQTAITSDLIAKFASSFI